MYLYKILNRKFNNFSEINAFGLVFNSTGGNLQIVSLIQLIRELAGKSVDRDYWSCYRGSVSTQVK